jgi:DNA topoisomerase-6 subunit B
MSSNVAEQRGLFGSEETEGTVVAHERTSERKAKGAAAKGGRPKAKRPEKAPAKAAKPAKPEKEVAEPPKKPAPEEGGNTIAHQLAAKQREISVSEFFTKNRHLLGFDNPRKALLTAIKEAVDNSLDACEEAGILPDIRVEILPTSREDRFRVVVEDNGPGIVKAQLPQVFARLLYGSKFHVLKQQRGQQGIGISAAAMYGQLTTGKPLSVISRIGKKHVAHYVELKIDTARNKPEVLREMETDWDKEHGTRIELELEAKVQKGRQSVDEYLQHTAIANPHATIEYVDWEKQKFRWERGVKSLPAQPKEIQPHPYGVEVGMLGGMMKTTQSKQLGAFLKADFSRVSPRVANQICEKAGVSPKMWITQVEPEQIEKIHHAMGEVKILAPATDCLVPIGDAGLIAGMKKVLEADLYLAETRPPKIYRGNPFAVEVGVAYGGKLPLEEPIRLMRFANRVPLLYQQGACCTTKAIITTDWRNYMLSQPKDSLPVGPMALVVHLASAWVPFTSEAKEAIAHYPEIIKEIRLALMEIGRKIASHIRKRHREADEAKKRNYIDLFLPTVVDALKEILQFDDATAKKTSSNLRDVLEATRKAMV